MRALAVALVLALLANAALGWHLSGAHITWTRSAASPRVAHLEVLTLSACCAPNYVDIEETGGGGGGGFVARVLLDDVTDVTSANTPAGLRAYRARGVFIAPVADVHTYVAVVRGVRVAGLGNAADANTPTPLLLQASIALGEALAHDQSAPALASADALRITGGAAGLVARALAFAGPLPTQCRLATLSEAGVDAPTGLQVDAQCRLTWPAAHVRNGLHAVQLVAQYADGASAPIDVAVSISGVVSPHTLTCAVSGPASVTTTVGSTASVTLSAAMSTVSPTSGWLGFEVVASTAAGGLALAPAAGTRSQTGSASVSVSLTGSAATRGNAYPVRVRFFDSYGNSVTCSAALAVEPSSLRAVVPAAVATSASALVTISGSRLGSGSDITAVRLGGIDAVVVSQTPDSVVAFLTPQASAVTGNVEVRSASHGITRGLAFDIIASASAAAAPPCPSGHAPGYWCVLDGVHNSMFYQCSSDFQGWRHCPPSEGCAVAGFHESNQCRASTPA